MRSWRLIAFLAIVVAQVLVVSTMAIGQQEVLDEGERVVLGTRPVDPRDLFRGDYVTLAYEIGSIDTRIVTWDAPGPEAEQVVWVVLQPEGHLHQPVAVVSTIDYVAQAAIRGVVDEIRDHIVSIRFGIEEYFVPEGRGHEVDRADSVEVVAAISDDGRAVIDHLIVDGEHWD